MLDCEAIDLGESDGEELSLSISTAADSGEGDNSLSLSVSESTPGDSPDDVALLQGTGMGSRNARGGFSFGMVARGSSSSS